VHRAKPKPTNQRVLGLFSNEVATKRQKPLGLDLATIGQLRHLSWRPQMAQQNWQQIATSGDLAVFWVNNSGSIVTWQNNVLQIVVWAKSVGGNTWNSIDNIQ
jgi:hypothetical protein